MSGRLEKTASTTGHSATTNQIGSLWLASWLNLSPMARRTSSTTQNTFLKLMTISLNGQVPRQLLFLSTSVKLSCFNFYRKSTESYLLEVVLLWLTKHQAIFIHILKRQAKFCNTPSIWKTLRTKHSQSSVFARDMKSLEFCSTVANLMFLTELCCTAKTSQSTGKSTLATRVTCGVTCLITSSTICLLMTQPCMPILTPSALKPTTVFQNSRVSWKLLRLTHMCKMEKILRLSTPWRHTTIPCIPLCTIQSTNCWTSAENLNGSSWTMKSLTR